MFPVIASVRTDILKTQRQINCLWEAETAGKALSWHNSSIWIYVGSITERQSEYEMCACVLLTNRYTVKACLYIQTRANTAHTAHLATLSGTSGDFKAFDVYWIVTFLFLWLSAHPWAIWDAVFFFSWTFFSCFLSSCPSAWAWASYISALHLMHNKLNL